MRKYSTTRVSVTFPDTCPDTVAIPSSLIVKARTKITNASTVGEYRAVVKAQEKIEDLVVLAAMLHLKRDFKVDIEKDRPNWRSFPARSEGTWNRGALIVEEYLHDERRAPERLHSWTLSKADLIRMFTVTSK